MKLISVEGGVMLQLNSERTVYIVEPQTGKRVQVRYHSLSRKSGCIFVVEEETGKFREVEKHVVQYAE